MPHLWLPVVAALLSANFSFSAVLLEKIDYNQNSQFICTQGISDCRIRDEFLRRPVWGPVNVSNMELKPLLCCTEQRNCRPCLEIKIQLIVAGKIYEDPEQSAEDEDDVYKSLESEEAAASLSLCYNAPPLLSFCKRLEFNLLPAVLEENDTPEVWLSVVISEKVYFDSQVMVQVYPSTLQRIITFPSIQDVCSSALHRDVEGCDVPTIRTEIDWKKAVVTLQLDDDGAEHIRSAKLYMSYGDQGERPYRQWQQNHTEKITIPLISVAPCLCFKVWWTGSIHPLRAKSCPFVNQTELIKNVLNNVTVSVDPVPTNNNETALSWTLSAPCRVDAELWLCQMPEGGIGHCGEVQGSRKRLHVEKRTTGKFSNIIPHPYLCVQVKVLGKDGVLDTICPFANSRRRWTLAVLLAVLVVCLGMFGLYLLQGTLKRWAWRWFKGSDVRGALDGGKVVLLCPPDPDPTLPALMCRLGSTLSALGFSVSLDLWCSAELSALGPVPWLHSRLDWLQRHGSGKVVLVITSAAWRQAQEWARSGQKAGCPDSTAPPCGLPARADVFSASLSCILADCLQGRAGERFVLAHFESLPPLPLGASHCLPELFQGIPLYSLPSQSLAFLTELMGDCGKQSRRRRACRLRAGSRALALGLGRPGDLWEEIPLNPCRMPHWV
uniref:Interleukin-17 receptor C-like n=1 Tax=Paramormyrops kingsleyae TaxID=1676925 RepID=A0A3B3RJZ3_9TELE|nr:interleukin-17 receptor C-like [Paramormyrops kingsleyae]XP_023652529.1 interleukin-17 receptor C-like [Paramormyrops kingsleyae]XP_023652530.1 interleukin-17 receptor C-like [Paramormyrops kingsleyae]